MRRPYDASPLRFRHGDFPGGWPAGCRQARGSQRTGEKDQRPADLIKSGLSHLRSLPPLEITYHGGPLISPILGEGEGPGLGTGELGTSQPVACATHAVPRTEPHGPPAPYTTATAQHLQPSSHVHLAYGNSGTSSSLYFFPLIFLHSEQIFPSSAPITSMALTTEDDL